MVVAVNVEDLLPLNTQHANPRSGPLARKLPESSRQLPGALPRENALRQPYTKRPSSVSNVVARSSFQSPPVPDDAGLRTAGSGRRRERTCAQHNDIVLLCDLVHDDCVRRGKGQLLRGGKKISGGQRALKGVLWGLEEDILMREGNWGRMYGERPKLSDEGSLRAALLVLGTALLGGHQGPSGGPSTVNHLPGSAQTQLNSPQQTRLPI